MADSTFISRVVLKNYRSIASCDVRLGPLCFLVGPNGSGKSNFLDALRLVSDSLNSTLDHALRDRGGIEQVRRRSSGHPTHFSIELGFMLPDGGPGHYEMRVRARPQGGFEVQTEKLETGRFMDPAFYETQSGQVVRSSLNAAPVASSDRLYLVNVSGLPEFRPIYEALTRMGFYNLNPQEIRELQPPDSGEVLARDGANIASILRRLASNSPDTKKRIEEYLAKVVPGISTVDAQSISSRETLEFGQEVDGAKHPWRFPAANMSDGTLRALGNLVALFQFSNGHSRRASLVGIEEPETALHPAAAGILRDSLREASRSSQVLVTSHSPDLLDDDSIPEEQILAVVAEQGKTLINRIDEAGRSSLKDRLFTAGELLRLDQLRPEPQSQPTENDGD
jgi:predicted ATPase